MADIQLTFIIPMYNSSEHILDCLKSVTGYEHTEVIVVDDGSSDDSVNIVKDYFAKQSGHNYLFSREHQGISLTRRFGVEQSHSDYIAFLDSDDHVNVPAYLELLKAMQRNAVSLAMGRLHWGPRTMPLPSVNIKFHDGIKDVRTDKELLVSFLTLLTGKIFTKDLLRYYTSSSSANEDVECVPYMIVKAGKVFTGDAVIYHRVNRDDSVNATQITDVTNFRAIENTLSSSKLLKQHFADDGLLDLYRDEVDAIILKQFCERLTNIRLNPRLKNKDVLSDIVVALLRTIVPDFADNPYYRKHFANTEIYDRFCLEMAQKALKKLILVNGEEDDLLNYYKEALKVAV